MAHLDAYNRPISYLRVSVTDRCNLRCIYCMPPQGVPWRPHADILRYEEIETIVRAAAELGVSKVRLTGGEPLVRPDVIELARMLARIPGVDDLAMTTNGILLAGYAADLATAGLQRVNVSLDTLQPERFGHITRGGRLADVLAGIEAAQRVGLTPIKINTVVVRGMNEDEVLDFARKTREAAWNVRFIELMPIGGSGLALSGSEGLIDEKWQARVVTAAEIRREIETVLGPLSPAKMSGGGPARYYRLSNAQGTVGFITPISEHFCYRCNRLRLTADGRLRPCLLSEREIDLRGPLRQGADVAQIKALILQAIESKPPEHRLDEQAPAHLAMSQIGG